MVDPVASHASSPRPTPAAPSARVHLDAGGSARLHPLARQALDQALAEGWADPHRLHSESRRAAALLWGAREAVAGAVGARTEEVHFAPSHVAALHAGVRAVALGRRRTGTTVVTSAVERAAVLDAAAFVTARGPDGARHEIVGVDPLGRVDAAAFSRAIASPGVALAALQHSNGEVGTLQPLEAVHHAARAAGVPLLVDAGAALGHVEIPTSWDLLAADSADWGGPTGVGVLVVRRGVRSTADWPEDSGTWFPGGVAVPSAFAAAVALQACIEDRDSEDARRRALVDLVRTRVPQLVADVEVVGDPLDRLPHVATFSCLFVDGEALVSELDRAGFAVGSGSACTSSALEPSHVLAAMGVLTHGNVRIGVDRTTTLADVERFLATLPGAVARVRAMLGVESL
ncbi:cysteine desulfurase family protein [Sanguibacter gelidistatuariae]|uniref:cysteine desulfurase family protein n=1 Tax=Sanguibacter gelidistatuariae TaxID=1814289 RepID=UPI001FE1C465|nr:aminotransferase class V-fold PLP-dependent enzyme [Sanguibacter gelidistatuariae]